MSEAISKNIDVDGKSLSVHIVSFHDELLPPNLMKIIDKAFRKVSPFISDETQTIYLRDIKHLSIGNKYPAGNCYNRHEIMISVPNWKVNKEQIIATVNHELHHMARWQNVGYGTTLGGAIVSEGIATYYEKLQSEWQSPWSQGSVKQSDINDALNEWDNEKYDHSEWFFNGTNKKWLGYAIGLKLACHIFKGGFDLEKSILVKADEAKSILSKGFA